MAARQRRHLARAGAVRARGRADERRDPKIAQGPNAAGWDAFEANLLQMADQLFRNSFVNDSVYTMMAARYDTCNVMDAGMTVADAASLALLAQHTRRPAR